MRPEKLELEGFTAFRDKSEISFEDADLFVLVGPTGAGKSSIIDAMIFALYGSIPRLRKGRVEPVISLGSAQARIRFTFSVGEARYSATRVVQRTKSGATTAEARLEGRAVDVIGAAEVTEAVQSLLGLTYEHFTKSVVLPQGTFASFLLGGSSDRQALLRELLDLGRYARLRDFAVQRAQASEVRAESLAEVLRQLTEVSTEAVAELESRSATLGEVVDWAAGERNRLEAARLEHAELRRHANALDQSLTVLVAMGLPTGLTELDDQLAAARLQRDELAANLDKAAMAFEQAQEGASRAGDAGEVARLLATFAQLKGLDERTAALRTEQARLEVTVERSRKAAESAAAAAEAAAKQLELIRTEHAAHAIRSTLTLGDDCPVCRQTVDLDRLASDQVASSLVDEAETNASKTSAARTQAQADLVQASVRLEQCTDQLSAITAERDSLDELLAGKTREQLEADQQVIAATRSDVDSAAKALSSARKDIDGVDRVLSELTESAANYWSTLDRYRMATTEFNPPDIARKDLLSEWTTFLDWRDKQLATVHEEASRLSKSVDETGRAIAGIEAEVSRRIAGAGVEIPPGSDPYELAAVGRARLEERLERMRSDLDRKIQAAAQVEGYQTDATVARSLADHLKVNGFERWLIEEIVRDLVLHANSRLEQLTSGAYALAVDKSEFVIIDRLNANERRAPETLSGGETFVVSLALALSLADQMASISMAGTARLESVFLDEGFGTLDSETLDTVASVIHELGADGRTVGLITHVRELALQIPIRFEVSKQAGTAVVKRVET